MFAQRHLRRIAAHMLLVWLLALAAGVANACLLEPPPAARGAGLSAIAHDVHQHDQHGSSKTANAPCVKFCSDTATGSQTTNVQPDENAVLLAPPSARGLVPDDTAMATAGAIALDPRARIPGVPIPIAFLRLTL